MAHVLAGEGAANRAELPPVWWLFAGPLLFAVIVTGWVWMLLAKAAAPWRAIAFAAAAVLVLVAASGAKGYYAVVAPPFMAAGALLLDRWLARGHRRLRVVSFMAVAALSGALVAYLTLPILPVATFATTSLPAKVSTSAEQIGWPRLVAQVQQVVVALPAEQRAMR